MRTRDVVYSTGLTVCTVFELMQSTTVAHALESAALDGFYLGILYYGLLWVSKQIYGECAGGRKQTVPAAEAESVVRRSPSRV